MTHDTTARNSGSTMTKRIAIGAASVLTAGALLGVGVAGASADTLTPVASPTATSSSHAHGMTGHSGGIGSLARQIRTAFFGSTVDGASAQKFAAAAVARPKLFEKFPTALQADLTTLKNASAADRDADARKITTTALDGGYGTQLQSVATALKSGAKHPLSSILRDAIRDGLAQGATRGHDLGTSAQKGAPTTDLDTDGQVTPGGQATAGIGATAGN
jgi:hypothetical protein